MVRVMQVRPTTIQLPSTAQSWANVQEPQEFARRLRLFRIGEMSEDDFRRFRLQHGVYSSRFQPNYSLIRIKIPGGVVSPDQLERIGEVAAKFSIGSAHVTTRQDFQLHWLVLGEGPEILI